MADPFEALKQDADFMASGRDARRDYLIATDKDFAQASEAVQNKILGSFDESHLSKATKQTWQDVKSILQFPMRVIDLAITPPPPPPEGETYLSQGIKEMVQGGKESVIPMVTQTVGGLVGKLGGPIGSSIGAGAGAVAGNYLNTAVLGTPAPSMHKNIIDFGLAAAGTRAASPDVRTPSRTEQAFNELGIEPKVTDLNTGRVPAILERGVSQLPTGQRIAATNEQQAQGLTTAADDWMSRVAGPEARDPVVVGRRVQESVRRTIRTTAAEENRLFAETSRLSRDPARPNLQVETANLRRAAGDILRSQDALLPQQRDAALGGLAQNVLDAPARVTWDQIRAWQRQFGADAGRPELIAKVPKADNERLFAAALTDMEASATASGRQDVLDAFRRARDYAARRREIYRDGAIADVMDRKPEEVVRSLSLQSGPTTVRNTREAILGPTPDQRNNEAWQLVQRHIFEGIFAPEGAGGVTKRLPGMVHDSISGPALQKRVDKIGEQTLSELLPGPDQRRGFDNIALVANAMKSAERRAATGYTSSTPQGLTVQGLATGAAFGASGPAAAVATILTPWAAAYLLTSPRAARILASEAFGNVATGARLGGQIGRESQAAVNRLIGILAERQVGAAPEPVSVPATRGLFSGPTGVPQR
jgi:hypothetical protein